jgi:hypothetical protein
MYSTCLFCLERLETNQVIETFPIGRRLAFDGARGRLWVVCLHCNRWNLSPLDERLEVIDVCERLFVDTHLRFSTEHIGLARLKEGLELVRIGDPKLPEFAAWRYGDRFAKRRRANLLRAGIEVIRLGVYQHPYGAQVLLGSPNKIVARIPTDAGDARWGDPHRRRAAVRDTIKVRLGNLPWLQLVRQGPDGWAVGVRDEFDRPYRLHGEDAVHAVGLLVPYLNRYAGTKHAVDEAVDMLEAAVDPLRFFERAALSAASKPAARIAKLPEAKRLALEMAAHEETEQRALEGELAKLEAAWREAEELAAIADGLLVPDSTKDFIREHRLQT